MARSRELDALGTIAAHPWLFGASALLGVAASTLTFLVIQLTNSVTLKARALRAARAPSPDRQPPRAVIRPPAAARARASPPAPHRRPRRGQVINTARNAAFVLFTIVVLGEPASRLQIFGYSISVAAFSSYTYFKVHKY
jgi:hypothetical protein